MVRVDPNVAARAALEALPRGRWIVARTPLEEPYPCMCSVRPTHAIGWKNWQCSPAFCACAGRSDPQEPECCGWRVSPAQVIMAKAAWELKRRAAQDLL